LLKYLLPFLEHGTDLQPEHPGSWGNPDIPVATQVFRNARNVQPQRLTAAIRLNSILDILSSISYIYLFCHAT